MIVTTVAVNKVKAIMVKENKTGFLRLGVQGGGCSGYNYLMDFVEEKRDNDTLLEFDGLKVIIDPKSLVLLENLELDYKTGLLDSGFKFNNSKAKSTCSCGTSFNI